jgi:hypothetical protein
MRVCSFRRFCGGAHPTTKPTAAGSVNRQKKPSCAEGAGFSPVGHGSEVNPMLVDGRGKSVRGDGRTMRQTNASSMISSRTCFRYSPRLIQPLGHARHSTISAYRARTVLTEIERYPFARSNTFEVPPSGQQAVTLHEGIAWERSSIGQRFRTHRRQIRAKRMVMTNQRLCQSTGL